MKYDYLIVGAGLFGATFAHLAKKVGKTCIIIDQRNHIGGNLYCKKMHGITVHMYGPHIFHTNDKRVYDFVTSLVNVHPYCHQPIAMYNDTLYNLPFNMNTFYQMWGVKSAQEAKNIINKQSQTISNTPSLRNKAISMVGTDIYHKLIEGYTEKQWGRDCKELPSFIIKRLPLRFTYDNNYFNDRYQGIPIGGYTGIIEKMLEGTEVLLDTDYREFTAENGAVADKVLYTGMIDEYYEYKLGVLEYRSVRFEQERYEMENYQGNAVVNYTDREIPYTRIIEHKHFEYGKQPVTIISKEYSSEWHKGDEPYYPVNNEKNNALYEKYRQLAENEENVIFGGRLGNYKYYDMDKVIEAALKKIEELE